MLFFGKIAEFFEDWMLQNIQNGVSPNVKRSYVIGGIDCFSSSELGYGGEPKGHLISILVGFVVKASPTTSSSNWLYYRFRLQRCSQDPLTVIDICNGGSLFDWENGHEHEAFSGRIRPLVADCHLFCKWKESCCALYDWHCNKIFTGSSFLIFDSLM